MKDLKLVLIFIWLACFCFPTYIGELMMYQESKFFKFVPRGREYCRVIPTRDSSQEPHRDGLV